MKSSLPKSVPDKTGQPHESGALAGWGLVIGAVVGMSLGWLIGHALIAGIFSGTAGWLIGAFIERARK
ncbi:MAG: hypothetical protein WC485_01235 [Opitutaceae bacterium]